MHLQPAFSAHSFPQYLVNRLKNSDSEDLIVLKQLILQMSGLDSDGV